MNNILTEEQLKLQREHYESITEDYLNMKISNSQGSKYLTIRGIDSCYDGGKEALDQDTILNYMFNKGYKFIHKNNYPAHRFSNLYLFEKINNTIEKLEPYSKEIQTNLYWQGDKLVLKLNIDKAEIL